MNKPRIFTLTCYQCGRAHKFSYERKLTMSQRILRSILPASLVATFVLASAIMIAQRFPLFYMITLVASIILLYTIGEELPEPEAEIRIVEGQEPEGEKFQNVGTR